MIIINHLLCRDDGTPYPFMESPNHGGVIEPEILTMHYSAGGGVGAVTAHFMNPDVDASAHALIGRDLSITQYVPFNIRAWHAGVSCWDGRERVNDFSIGIELDNAGMLARRVADQWGSWWGRLYPGSEVVVAVHKNRAAVKGWHIYRPEQIDVAVQLAKLLVSEYNLSQIVGHDDVAPDRKTDPGPAFPMDEFVQRVMDHDDRDVLTPIADVVMKNAWEHRLCRPSLRMLVEEVGELAAALAGDHEHPPEWELRQIAGIALHWLINIKEPNNRDWV